MENAWKQPRFFASDTKTPIALVGAPVARDGHLEAVLKIGSDLCSKYHATNTHTHLFVCLYVFNQNV